MTVKAVSLCISGFLVQIIYGQCNTLSAGIVGNGLDAVGKGMEVATIPGTNSLGNNILNGNNLSGGTVFTNNGIARTGLITNSATGGASLLGNGLTGGNGINVNGLTGYGTNLNNLIIGNGFDINNCGTMSVISSSPIAPNGLSVSSMSQLDGPVLVSGQLPFLAAAAMGGIVPSGGFGTASYGSNGKVGIFSENGVGVGTTVNGIANNGIAKYGNSGYGLNEVLSGGNTGPAIGFGNSLVTTGFI